MVSKSGSEFLVNTTTAGVQSDPSVAALPGGRFVVTWSDFSQTDGDTSGYAVRGQVFDASGAKVGPEFLVNTTTLNHQHSSSVAALSNGGFVVTWTDESQTDHERLCRARTDVRCQWQQGRSRVPGQYHHSRGSRFLQRGRAEHWRLR